MHSCKFFKQFYLFTVYFSQKNWDMPESFEEYAFSYECKPLQTNYCSAAEVLEFRDKAWQKYFTNPSYLNKVKEMVKRTQKILMSLVR